MDAHLSHTSFVHLMCATGLEQSPLQKKKFLPCYLKKNQSTIDVTIPLLSGLIAKISKETDCVQSLQRNGQTIPVQDDSNLYIIKV